MIIMVRRTSILLVVLICILSYMTFNLCTEADVPAIALPTSNRVIMIDAGHGGIDGGATGQSGVMEKDINLSIALKLQTLIEHSGGIVVITRADDRSIHDEDKTTIRAKKVSDLKNRKAMITESQADVFISIHLNKFEQPQYFGAQVFYSTTNEKSKTLASFIQKELVDNLGDGNRRDIKPAPKEIFILRDVAIPAVIVECGFLSNPEEERKLQNEQYQQKIAWNIYVALMKYFNNM